MVLDTIVLPCWGSVPPREIEFEDIQDWIVSLSESGSSRFVGRGLSASRTIQSYQVLSQVLRFAIKAKRLAANPADDVDLPTMMSGARRYLTHVEVMQLAMGSGRFRPLVFTLAYTGIRFGEAIALRTADVDLVRNRITINRSVTGVTGKGIVETDTKEPHHSGLPVPGILAEDLANILGGRRPDALVFPSHKGGHLTSTEFRWVFDQAAKDVDRDCSARTPSYRGFAGDQRGSEHQGRTADARTQDGDADPGSVRAPVPG